MVEEVWKLSNLKKLLHDFDIFFTIAVIAILDYRHDNIFCQEALAKMLKSDNRLEKNLEKIRD